MDDKIEVNEAGGVLTVDILEEAMKKALETPITEVSALYVYRRKISKISSDPDIEILD